MPEPQSVQERISTETIITKDSRSVMASLEEAFKEACAYVVPPPGSTHQGKSINKF